MCVADKLGPAPDVFTELTNQAEGRLDCASCIGKLAGKCGKDLAMCGLAGLNQDANYTTARMYSADPTNCGSKQNEACCLEIKDKEDHSCSISGHESHDCGRGRWSYD